MEHPDWSAFLAAIVADPDDDTARLVAADFLEENGDADRAAFIRIQVELARLEAMGQSKSLEVDHLRAKARVPRSVVDVPAVVGRGSVPRVGASAVARWRRDPLEAMTVEGADRLAWRRGFVEGIRCRPRVAVTREVRRATRSSGLASRLLRVGARGRWALFRASWASTRHVDRPRHANTIDPLARDNSPDVRVSGRPPRRRHRFSARGSAYPFRHINSALSPCFGRLGSIACNSSFTPFSVNVASTQPVTSAFAKG